MTLLAIILVVCTIGACGLFIAAQLIAFELPNEPLGDRADGDCFPVTPEDDEPLIHVRSNER